MNLVDLLAEHKIVAIFRGISPKDADAAATALIAGGIRLMEVTMNTAGALDIMSGWLERFEGQAHVGAGTVLNLSMAKEAVAAGAQFLISPNLDESVVAYGMEHGVEVWPGVMTPTEIVRAWNAGARAVKIFPMGALGTRYLKELQGPLDHIPMLATGGVDLTNIGEYFKAGATAVGLGGNLIRPASIAAGQFEDLTETARQFVAAANGATRG